MMSILKRLFGNNISNSGHIPPKYMPMPSRWPPKPPTQSNGYNQVEPLALIKIIKTETFPSNDISVFLFNGVPKADDAYMYMFSEYEHGKDWMCYNNNPKTFMAKTKVLADIMMRFG